MKATMSTVVLLLRNMVEGTTVIWATLTEILRILIGGERRQVRSCQ